MGTTVYLLKAKIARLLAKAVAISVVGVVNLYGFSQRASKDLSIVGLLTVLLVIVAFFVSAAS